MNKIIFTDLDGTLEDSRVDMAESVVRVRKSFDLSSPAISEITPNVNRGMDELYRKCFADYLDSKKSEGEEAFERVRLAYEADYLANVSNHTRLYDGIQEVIPKLAQIAKLVLVTNKPEKISAQLLKNLGIDAFYSVIMGGDSCPENKPSALPLKLAAQKLGLEHAKAFMIGDSQADVLAGQNYGAKTIWCQWGYAANTGTLIPDFSAKHPEELLKICAL